MGAVIVTLPAGLSSEGVEIAVPVGDEDGTAPWFLEGDVLIRPAHSAQRWERLQAVGGTVAVRK